MVLYHIFVISFSFYIVSSDILYVWLQFNNLEAAEEVHEALLQVLNPAWPPSPVTNSNEEGPSPKIEAAVDGIEPLLDPVGFSSLYFSFFFGFLCHLVFWF